MDNPNFFLKLDDIKGESKVYNDYIDVSTWRWGVSNEGSFHSGGGAGVGTARFDNMSIDKVLDSASPILMKYCSTGDHFTTGILECWKMGGTPIKYYEITLTNVLITGYSNNGYTGQVPSEQILLNFQEFKCEYREQKDDGTASAGVTFNWDISKNKSS